MSNQRLHVATAALNVRAGGGVVGGRFVPGRISAGSGVSSTCSSGSVSPIPIPVIAISPGDESSESEIETEPAKIFHRRVSTKRNVNSSVSILQG